MIEDRVKTLDRVQQIRWGMVTATDVEVIDSQSARLSQGGETAVFRIESPSEPTITSFNTADPPRSFDKKHPGTQMLGFTVELEPNCEALLKVSLTLE